MDVELYWLIPSAFSGATLLVTCWTAFRLRTRGVSASFGAGATTGGGVLTEPHVHAYDTMLSDGIWRCGICGEPRPRED